MSAWLNATCEALFSRAVPASFVFAFLDCVVSIAFKIAFLGRSTISVNGGKMRD